MRLITEKESFLERGDAEGFLLQTAAGSSRSPWTRGEVRPAAFVTALYFFLRLIAAGVQLE